MHIKHSASRKPPKLQRTISVTPPPASHDVLPPPLASHELPREDDLDEQLRMEWAAEDKDDDLVKRPRPETPEWSAEDDLSKRLRQEWAASS